MSIQRLKTLLAVAETGSFQLAAERVHLTAAAVGQQMKALESEIGQPLFDRDTRVPRLNALGHSLLPRARKLVTDYESLMSGTDAEELEELTIGAVDTVMTGLVPELLLQRRLGNQHLRLRIVPGLSAELLAQVDRGSVDAAIISSPRHRHPQFAWRTIAREPLVLITPPSLSDGEPEEILRRYPFIRFSRNAWVGEQIDDWLLQRGIQVRESMELASLEGIHTMVSSDLGVSIVPDHCVTPRRAIPLKRIPLGDDFARVLGLLWRLDNPGYRAIDSLANDLVSLVTANK